MAITIRHLEGLLEGREQHFDDSVEVITFGRSAECEVVFPLECAEVGAKHFQLRRLASGDYVVSLFENRLVAIDGIPAEGGAVVTSGSVIRLGGRDGPCIRVDLGRQMQEIAWSAAEADPDNDEVLSGDWVEAQSDRLVDLLFERKSKSAVVAGLTAETLAERAQPLNSLPLPNARCSSASSSYRQPQASAAPPGTLGHLSPRHTYPNDARQSQMKMRRSNSAFGGW